MKLPPSVIEDVKRYKNEMEDYFKKLENPPEGFVLVNRDRNPIGSTKSHIALLDELLNRIK